MKNLFLLLFLCLVAQLSRAQATFEYDAAGNRVKRTVIGGSDLVLQPYFTPGTVYGASPVTIVILVYQLEPVPTPGTVTVYLTKNTPLITLNFDPTATFIGGRFVQNAQWTMDATSNATYYIMTSTTPIAAQGGLTFGLSGSSVAANQNSHLSYSAIVLPVTGEINISNNTGAVGFDYFANRP